MNKANFVVICNHITFPRERGTLNRVLPVDSTVYLLGVFLFIKDGALNTKVFMPG